MIHAKLTKLSTLPDAKVNPFGGRGLGPIVDGYICKGYYEQGPTIGLPFTMMRYESQSVEAGGIIRTSRVALVSRNDDGSIGFNTRNSKYHLTPLP